MMRWPDGRRYTCAASPGLKLSGNIVPVHDPAIIRAGDAYHLFSTSHIDQEPGLIHWRRSTDLRDRSQAPDGPYLDREGRDMMDGGGSLVLHADLDSAGRYAGPGHCAVLRDGDADYIVYHAYDLTADGAPTLRIQELAWNQAGWSSAI